MRFQDIRNRFRAIAHGLTAAAGRLVSTVTRHPLLAASIAMPIVVPVLEKAANAASPSNAVTTEQTVLSPAARLFFTYDTNAFFNSPAVQKAELNELDHKEAPGGTQAVQLFLKDKGFYKGTISGVADIETLTALRKFLTSVEMHPGPPGDTVGLLSKYARYLKTIKIQVDGLSKDTIYDINGTLFDGSNGGIKVGDGFAADNPNAARCATDVTLQLTRPSGVYAGINDGNPAIPFMRVGNPGNCEVPGDLISSNYSGHYVYASLWDPEKATRWAHAKHPYGWFGARMCKQGTREDWNAGFDKPHMFQYNDSSLVRNYGFYVVTNGTRMMGDFFHYFDGDGHWQILMAHEEVHSDFFQGIMGQWRNDHDQFDPNQAHAEARLRNPALMVTYRPYKAITMQKAAFDLITTMQQTAGIRYVRITDKPVTLSIKAVELTPKEQQQQPELPLAARLSTRRGAALAQQIAGLEQKIEVSTPVELPAVQPHTHAHIQILHRHLQADQASTQRDEPLLPANDEQKIDPPRVGIAMRDPELHANEPAALVVMMMDPIEPPMCIEPTRSHQPPSVQFDSSESAQTAGSNKPMTEMASPEVNTFELFNKLRTSNLPFQFLEKASFDQLTAYVAINDVENLADKMIEKRHKIKVAGGKGKKGTRVMKEQIQSWQAEVHEIKKAEIARSGHKEYAENLAAFRQAKALATKPVRKKPACVKNRELQLSTLAMAA